MCGALLVLHYAILWYKMEENVWRQDDMGNRGTGNNSGNKGGKPGGQGQKGGQSIRESGDFERRHTDKTTSSQPTGAPPPRK